MRIVHLLRFITATVTCVCLMLVAAGPHLLWTLYVTPIFGGGNDRLRDRLFAWQTRWSSLLLAAFARMMRIRIDYDVPAERMPPNMIVIANHRSWIDIFLVAGALHRAGVTRLTAVVKRQILNIPVLGRFARSIRCAIVTRRDPENDLLAIRACARDSREAGASIVIFPEGTRFDARSRRREGYEAVLRPKTRGLEALLDELPDCKLIAVSILWPKNVRMRTIMEGATLVDKAITVKLSEVTRPETGTGTRQLLDSVWSAMDKDIAST